MMNKTVLAAIATGLALLVLFLWTVRRGYEDGTTRIGVVLPLSGGMAEYGVNAKQGLTLAEEELRARNDTPKFALIYQDSKEAPQDTVSVVRRLIDVDRVRFIIGGLTSSGVLAAAPYAQSRRVLFFSPAASAPGIPEIGDLVIRNWPGDDVLARQYGDACFRIGVREVAILHVSNDYGVTNATAFSRAFEAAGGKVSWQRSFAPGTTDFRDLAALLKPLPPAVHVFAIGYPDEYRSLLPAIAAAKIDSARLLLTDTFYSPDLLTQLAAVSDGALLAVAGKPGDDYVPRKGFIERYRRRFRAADGKPKSPGLVSDTAYDALNLVVTALSKTDGTPEQVSLYLRTRPAPYEGAAGLTTFTASGDVTGDLALYKVKAGKFVPLEK